MDSLLNQLQSLLEILGIVMSHLSVKLNVDGACYSCRIAKSNALYGIVCAEYTLGGVTHVTPITMDATYILTADDNSMEIDIGNPQMPKQVVLLEDGANLDK